MAGTQTASFWSCMLTRCNACWVSIRLVTSCSNLIVFQHSYQLLTTSTSSPSHSGIIVFGVKIHWLPEAHCIGFGPFNELDSRSASLHFLRKQSHGEGFRSHLVTWYWLSQSLCPCRNFRHQELQNDFLSQVTGSSCSPSSSPSTIRKEGHKSSSW